MNFGGARARRNHTFPVDSTLLLHYQWGVLITSENAATLGQKGGLASALARDQARLKRLQEIALASLAETYEGKTLARVRLQLDKVFEAFMAEALKQNPDAGKLDRLAAAQGRLGELERQLSGRSLPPSQKPVTIKRSKAQEQPRTTDPLPAEG